MNTIQEQEAGTGEQQRQSLFPLVEIELNGKVPFNQLINTFLNRYEVKSKLVKADIEYWGQANYGKMLLHLLGTRAHNEAVLRYLDEHKIRNAIKGYAA